MDSPFVEKAIPMVSVDQSSGKYVLTPQATNFLRAINGPIGVVSVAGLYRTGKSYLLNRVLLNRSNGFGVGPTVNPCTKGLWCWGTPIKGTSSDGEQVNIIVIDTEGIGALDEDQTHDTKIFTMAILASSCFIYNSVGSIDENAIQNLSLVVNLSKHIQLKSNGHDQDGADPDEISTYFPSFYWVVRDFSLQLQDAQGNQINSKEYLERALAPQNGFSDDIEEKNRIRRLLTAFFKDRDCYTMIRPLVDEQKLQNLDKMDYDELRPQFVHQAMSFRKRIISGIKVKTLQNQKLNGDMYCSMLSSYVLAINEGAVPNIENAWNYMCEEQCRKSLDQCYQIFIKEFKQNLKDLPKPEGDFDKAVQIAGQKSLESFRERALGQKSAVFLKELKRRIHEKTAQTREQNIKQSNQELRKYILKYVGPIKMKLNNQQYKSYPEFQKEVSAMFDSIFKDGPKLHGYKLIYTQALKKFSTQGAQFIFKNFSKNQEKEKQMFKLKEKELQTQLQVAMNEKQGLRKQLMQTNVSYDQKLADLNYQLETVSTRLKMTEKSKEEQQKKMERQILSKHSELQANRNNLQMKIKQMMLKLEQTSKSFNNQKKEWEKEKAVLDLKNKQQSIQIEELNRKEKTLDTNLNISKNQMANQVRQITQRHQKEADQLRKAMRQFEQKCNELNEELNNLKEQMQSKNEKNEKKEKKFKEDISNKGKQIEKIKKQFQSQKKKLMEQYEKLKENADKQYSTMEQRLKQSEKELKTMNQNYRKEKNSLESQLELLQHRYELTQNEYETEKLNHKDLKEKHQAVSDYFEQSFQQKSEETFNIRMSQLKNEYESSMNQFKTQVENEKKRLVVQYNNLLKKYQELEKDFENKRMESSRKLLEQQNIIEQLNDQIKHLKNMHKVMEGEKLNDISEIQNRYMIEIKELRHELEQTKQKSQQEKADQQRFSEQSIAQIKNGYEIEREHLERRIRSEKEKHARIVQQLQNQHEKKLEEQTEPIRDQLQDLQQTHANLQQMFRNQTSNYQHEIDMLKKRGDNLEKTLAQLQELLNKNEVIFNTKYDQLNRQSKVERQKLENKVESLVNENNRKDKDLMSTIHIRDQLASSLEKKEAKVNELQKQFQTQKETYSSQMNSLHSKISSMETEHHSKVTEYERDSALSKQLNEFNVTKIKELEKNLQFLNQGYEQKMTRFKQEKQIQTKSAIEKMLAQKNSMESKLKQYKASSKELEISLKKITNQYAKEKELAQMMKMNLESKCRQLQEKSTNYMTRYQTESMKWKEENSRIKVAYQTETKTASDVIKRLQNQLNDYTAKYEKQNILNEQKILFLTKSKEENKRDSEERIKKLETQVSILQSKNINEKSAVDNYYKQAMHNAESQQLKKISDLNQQIQRKTNQFESLIKDRDMQIKELKEKYQAEKVLRETSINKMQKKLNESIERERRAKEENQKMKLDKEKRQNQAGRKQKQERDALKTKIAQLQNQVKLTEDKRLNNFFEHEKEKSKWAIEKEMLNENIGNMQDQVKKFEREKEKLKTENEKLKTERKTTKTHSYIGSMKTIYQPPKPMVEQINKENFSQQ